MSLFQINIDEGLKKAIHKKAKHYGVTSSALVRIVLVNAFQDSKTGNIFNADRDNGGKGIKVEDLISKL